MAESLPDRSRMEAEPRCPETFETALARIFRMMNGDSSVEADRLLAQSQLQTFCYQMNPHFLFNALNSVEALSREAPARIPEFVRSLADYLRYALCAKQDGWTTLQQELDAMANYLRVEKVRFEDQLEVAFEIADAARRQRVPELLLQPLVESAIRHGMGTSPLPLRVVVSARCRDRWLQVEVRNTGAPSTAKTGSTIGWENLRRRLDLLYPRDGYRLASRESAGWVTSSAELPWEQ